MQHVAFRAWDGHIWEIRRTWKRWSSRSSGYRQLSAEPQASGWSSRSRGCRQSLGQNLKLALVFTGVSIARSYALRRLFEGTL